MLKLGVDVETWSRCQLGVDVNLELMFKLGVDVETWSLCLNLESMFEFGVDVKLCFNWSAITRENNKFCPIQYHFYFRNPLPNFCIEVPFYHCRAFLVLRVTGILNRKSDLPFSSFIRHHAQFLPKIHVSGHWKKGCSSHCPMKCSTCTFVHLYSTI